MDHISEKNQYKYYDNQEDTSINIFRSFWTIKMMNYAIRCFRSPGMHFSWEGDQVFQDGQDEQLSNKCFRCFRILRTKNYDITDSGVSGYLRFFFK